MSVQLLCLSPLTDGLFAKTVMSSGGDVHKLVNVAAPPERQYPFWQDAKKANPKMMLSASPCLDKFLVTGNPVELAHYGKQKNIPYMLGSTSQDVMPPFLFKMTKNWCSLQEQQSKQKSYVWFLVRKLPGDDNGAWHSSDLWYWFGTLDNCWRPMTDKDRDLSRQMTTYLTNFAKTGDPNEINASDAAGFTKNAPSGTTGFTQSSLAKWLPTTPSQGKVLRLGEGNTRMGGVNRAKLYKTMVTNKAVEEAVEE